MTLKLPGCGKGVGVQSEADAMLLDRYLPQYDVTETHAGRTSFQSS